MALFATHKDVPFHIGDTVRVHYRITEKETIAGKTKKSVKTEIKQRIQPFEGVVIAIRGEMENKSFTVRRLADQNIGVERIFPLASPWVEKIEVLQQGRVRRAKLYYLKNRANVDVKQLLVQVTKKRAKKPAAKPVKAEPVAKTIEPEAKPVAKKASSKAAVSAKGKTGRTPRAKASSK